MAYPFLVATIKSSLNNWVTIAGQADYEIKSVANQALSPTTKIVYHELWSLQKLGKK